MATHDQRLSALERAQADNNNQSTIMLGVIGEQGRDIKRIAATLEQQTALLEQHSQFLQEILNRLPPKE